MSSLSINYLNPVSLACVNCTGFFTYRRKRDSPSQGLHMNEEENGSVEETLQEVASPVESENEHADVSNHPQQSVSKRNDADYNWAEMRRQQRELQEEIERLKSPPKPQEDKYGFSDDDLIEGKHFKELHKEILKLKSDIQQRDMSSLDDRIKAKFPDFTDVVSKESIEFLNQNAPEMAAILAQTSDPYSKAVAAYKYLKATAPSTGDLHDKKKAVENLQKPVSANAVNKQSVLGNAKQFENGLNMTPEAQKHYWKEMQEAIKAG